MNKQQWKKLLTEATKVAKESYRIDDAFKKFCDVVNPSAYTIWWLNSDCLWGFMRAVQAIYDEDVYEHVSYWVYEVLPSKNKMECTYKGKKYNAKNMNEYVSWILAQE